jgi:hypothetical protein
MEKKTLMMFLAAFLSTSLIAPAQDQKATGPLAALPSKPGAHIEKIKALGDNEWLNLGAPAADPQWGKARGSSWGAKALILAPDKRGAFLFGEGVHAYVKPDGHIMDDLWFYDINAHAWLCLYPGTDTKTFSQRVKDKELLLDDHGLLRDKDGQAIPVHVLIHAWGYLAYDSDRKKFAFMGGPGWNRYYLGNGEKMEEGVKLLEEQMKGKPQTLFSPWYYDVATGKFERTPATGEATAGGGFSQVHYLPSRKQFIIVGATEDGVGFFDPAKELWSRAMPKGPAPAGYDGCGCFDTKRNRIYRNDGDGADGRGLMAYDIEKNTWIELKPKGAGPGPASTNRAFYEYDARLDRVVAIRFNDEGGHKAGIHVYDPETNSWADPLPAPKDVLRHAFAANTCYDRELNAFFCHAAGDSSDDGVMWVYRHKK